MQERHGKEVRKTKNIAFDKASARRIDENGYMHVTLTPISKACVNPYLGREIAGWEELRLDPNGIYYGYRAPEELEKAAETFNGIPLLLDHHDESAANPQKDFRVGSTGTDATFDGVYLRATLSITDAAAIALIESGEMKELSCAYFYEPEWTAGEANGVPYDFIMRNIRGNHVALVEEGRAGHDVKVEDSKRRLKSMRRAKAKDEAVEEVKTADTVEAVLAEFFPDLEEEKRAAFLEALKKVEAPKEEAADEEEEKATDEEETAEYKAGYEAGVKAAQEAKEEEPKEEEPEDEEKGKYVEAVAGDSLEAVKAKAKAELVAHYKAMSAAAKKCRAVIGDVDPLAFDSEADIYALALKNEGINPAAYPQEAYAGMVDMIRRNKPIAADHKTEFPSDGLPKSIADLI